MSELRWCGEIAWHEAHDGCDGRTVQRDYDVPWQELQNRRLPTSPPPATQDGERRSYGHGHVYPRFDGALARCGGPAICPDCAKDYFAKYGKHLTSTSPAQLTPPPSEGEWRVGERSDGTVEVFLLPQPDVLPGGLLRPATSKELSQFLNALTRRLQASERERDEARDAELLAHEFAEHYHERAEAAEAALQAAQAGLEAIKQRAGRAMDEGDNSWLTQNVYAKADDTLRALGSEPQQ